MSDSRTYHHGSLRESALDLAEAVVEASGHDAVAMRDLAQQLGVTPGALYRHFEGRATLLVTLADRIQERLVAELQDVMDKHAEPWTALEAACGRFLDFTARHERLFRMMYDDEVINAPDAEVRLPAMERSYRLLLGLVRRALPDATLREARLRLIGLWSALFGYASVQAHGALKPYMLAGLTEAAMRHAVIDAALGARPR